MRWTLLIGVILGGCLPPTVQMRPAAAVVAACDSDAYVVFLRPTLGGRSVEIREADGRILGRLEGQTWFGTAVAPGEHFFVAQTDRVDGRAVALKADLGAGATYYVDVEMVRGFAVMYAVADRLPYWSELPGWLAKCRPVELDRAGPGIAPPPSWPYIYSYALRWWRQLDDTRIAERKLILSDGLLEPPAFVKLGSEGCTARAPKPQPPPALVFTAASDPNRDKDVPKCTWEKVTGSNLRTRICRSQREAEEEYLSAWQFMNLPRVLATPPEIGMHVAGW